MAKVNEDLSTATRWRAARSGPFLAVALCFLLPFFTASSCGSGQETTATGVDILTGTKLIAEQTMQPMFGPTTELGPVGPDPEAQGVSDAARPWTIMALILTLLGAALVTGRRWYWRAASALAAAAAVCAMFKIGSTFRAPGQDISAGWGLILAGVILSVTALWRGIRVAIEIPAAGTRARSRTLARGQPTP
jgi:lysylphosphatidylglycerol synthetase-like protein (DUF2156 family)